ncbi:hypothetical protein [Mastigocoleus testarum]|uniref:hypothetical protein n=1 Tax=Mastigocoleus testarum TaxID=996925 RepID=UPI00040E835A|nr:hypothetical protein [Mastigocoleus testarum]
MANATPLRAIVTSYQLPVNNLWLMPYHQLAVFCSLLKETMTNKFCDVKTGFLIRDWLNSRLL